tara:strand:+ start:20024 stop:20968 length:945 start_codon:yes stop_codon:yes gene_type:complete
MDVLKQINKQIEEIKSEGHSAYLDLIYNHLDRAEVYYQKGENDEHYYNDVVYRTNQAFEGALKEAYKVLGGKSDEQIARVTPNKIEKYLKDENIFKERVLKLFENYRQEWRNKSTHDYKLVLDEHEAFLAFINVCSFVHLLLKQIQEKLAFDKEIIKERKAEEIKETQDIVQNKSDAFSDRILKLLGKFSTELNQEKEDLKEVEINGKLNAFLSKASDDLTIFREPQFSIGTLNIRPDFVLEYQSEKLIIEVKRRPHKGRIKADIDQLASYLAVSGIKNGILYFASSKVENNKLTVDMHNVTVNDTHLNIMIIF